LITVGKFKAAGSEMYLALQLIFLLGFTVLILPGVFAKTPGKLKPLFF